MNEENEAEGGFQPRSPRPVVHWYLGALADMGKFFVVLAWVFAPMLALPFAIRANALAPMYVLTGLWLLSIPFFGRMVEWAARRI